MERYDVKIKLRKNSTSEKLDMYEFKMDLFDNCKPEQFLLLVSNIKMELEVSGIITSNTKLQFLCNLLFGKSLCKFETLCLKIWSMTMTHLNQVILGLGLYSPPLNEFPKQKRAMRCGMIYLHELKVSIYAVRMVEFNE